MPHKPHDFTQYLFAGKIQCIATFSIQFAFTPTNSAHPISRVSKLKELLRFYLMAK